MDIELLEIKKKILNFCNKYQIKNFTVYLQQEKQYADNEKIQLITSDVDLEIEV